MLRVTNGECTRGGSQHYHALDRLCELVSLDDRWTVEYIWLGAHLLVHARSTSYPACVPPGLPPFIMTSSYSATLLSSLLLVQTGGNDGDLRSKTRTIEGPIRSIKDGPHPDDGTRLKTRSSHHLLYLIPVYLLSFQ